MYWPNNILSMIMILMIRLDTIQLDITQLKNYIKTIRLRIA